MSEVLIGDRLSLEDHISENVVLQKDGSTTAVFDVAGVFPGTADDAEKAAWFDVWHGALLNIGADDVGVEIYQCRGDANPDAVRDGPHTAEFAREMADAYRGNLINGSMYENKLYLAITVHAPNAAGQAISRFFADATQDPRAGINERRDRLNDLCELLKAQLRGFGLRRLGYAKRGHVLYSEIAEAIVWAMSGKWRQVPMTTGRMSHGMFSEAIRFRRKRVEFHGAGDPTYGEMYAFAEYPAVTFPGMFSDLSSASYRSTLVQSFRFSSNAEGMTVVGRKQNKMVAAGDKAISQIAALTEAADELMSRRWVLGNHSLVLICFANDPKAMTEVGNAAWRDLAACGVVAARVTTALQAAFLSIAPGGNGYCPRPGFVKSRNFVAFQPLYNFPAGAAQGHWGGPIATFRTMAGSPFAFHWQPPGSDVGNVFLTGASGSGKTLTTAFLLSMTAGRARIVALDHKRGWDHLIRRMGGDYAVLGAGEPNFAPLKALDASPRSLEFLTDLLRGCIGGTMTEEEGRRLAVGLTAIMTLPSEDRGLGELRAFFDNTPEGAGSRLEKWVHGNQLGWVLDAPVDTVNFGQLSGLDTTALLENPRARGPAMAYLFHRIAALLDGTPLLLPMDEGWRALIDETFRANIEKQLRTIRSKGGAVVFITQSPRDIIDSGIANILVEQCPTQLHLANPRGRREDYCNGLGLTDGQFDALHQLQGGTGLFLLVQGTSGVVLQLPMGPEMKSFIPILSAREIDLRRADKALTEAAA